MAGRGESPDGGSGSGGEDEYGAVVFDESFVKAAPLQEFSAQERLGPDHRPAVRRRRSRGERRGKPRNMRRLSLLLVVLALAFGTAVYFGVQRPDRPPTAYPPPRLNSLLIPLAPASSTALGEDAADSRGSGDGGDEEDAPGATQRDVVRSEHAPHGGWFAGTPSAHYRSGSSAIKLPDSKGTDNFSSDQVRRALHLAKQYLVVSNVEPEPLLGGGTARVRTMVDPRQYKQFDSSMDNPRDDGKNAATGWLTRFDPNQVSLATNEVRAKGDVTFRELNKDYLEVSTDHTFVYALQSADDKDSPTGALPFVVRRKMTLQFDQADIRDSMVRVVQSVAEAGPQSCQANAASFFRPVFPKPPPAAKGLPGTAPSLQPPGTVPDGASGSGDGGSSAQSAAPPRNSLPTVNPYDHKRSAANRMCGSLGWD